MSRIFITGSSGGLGRLAAKLLIEQGHSVVLHGRNASRSGDAVLAASGAEGVVTGDISTVAGAKVVADEANKLGPFDAVVHNAAIGYRQTRRMETEPGVPDIFAVNVLAPLVETFRRGRLARPQVGAGGPAEAPVEPAAPPQPEAAAPAAEPGLREWIGVLAMGVGLFMAIMDVQIVTSSLTQIQGGLSASADEIAWVQTAYLIADVVMVPMSGMMSRLLSTRVLFVAAALGFTGSSVLCASATSLGQMIVFRTMQGCVAAPSRRPCGRSSTPSFAVDSWRRLLRSSR